MENPMSNPTVFFHETFIEPLLYVRGYCQTLAGGRGERKMTGSDSALVEKEEYLTARGVITEKYVQGSVRAQTRVIA